MKTNKAYINYTDSLSCGGKNNSELFDNIINKNDCISTTDKYFDEKNVSLGIIENYDLFKELKLRIQKILDESNLKNFEDTLLIVASSVGGMGFSEKIFLRDGHYKNIDYRMHSIDAISYNIKKDFTFKDDVSFSTACTSGANALGYAKEVIKKGIYKNVLVIGAETLSLTTIYGFNSLSVLSSKPCIPFDEERDGMNVAEGIALLLLQDEKKDDSIELCGVGYSSDAYHMTAPSSDGYGAILAMENALKDAQVTTKDIKYINAHGTATQANDIAELNAIASLFEENEVYVSSTKSITGHTLGTAGTIEAIISCMAIRDSKIPPNKSLKNKIQTKLHLPTQALDLPLNYVLSNSFAFGGNNCCLVLGSVK